MGELSHDKIELLESIEFDWQAGRKKEEEKKWLKQYEDLKKFKAAYGHCNVPSGQKKFLRLYSWCRFSRDRVDHLTTTQKNLLNSLGFRWAHMIKKEKDTRWEVMYEKLKRFRKKYGHLNVTKIQDVKLNRWLCAQEERVNIPAERRVKLEKLGMVWKNDRRKSRDAHWNKMYAELKKFYQKNGHCIVPVKNKELRLWIQSLRLWNKTLTKEQHKKLSALNFDIHWTRKDYVNLRWQNRYEELKEFYRQSGHTRLPKKMWHNVSLYNWTKRLRQIKHKLSNEQILKLNKIEFPWHPRK